jgi:hypothetical protein
MAERKTGDLFTFPVLLGWFRFKYGTEGGHSEALSSYLTAMAQCHNYSFQNILLIASHRPTASRVSGVRHGMSWAGE